MSDNESNEHDVSRLLQLASNGDPQAIDDVLVHFEAEIRLIARRQLGPSLRPYADSMDVVQSLRVDLLNGLRDGKFQFSSQAQLLALATLIVRRKSAKLWRKHCRQQRDSGLRPSADGLADALLSSDRNDDPTFDIGQREQVELVLSQMTDRQRQLVALRMEGLSTAEAARELDWDPDVARVSLSRLRQRLKMLGIRQLLI